MWTSVTEIVGQLFATVGTVISTVIANPILLIGLSLGFVSGAIGIFKRIRR